MHAGCGEGMAHPLDRVAPEVHRGPATQGEHPPDVAARDLPVGHVRDWYVLRDGTVLAVQEGLVVAYR